MRLCFFLTPKHSNNDLGGVPLATPMAPVKDAVSGLTRLSSPTSFSVVPAGEARKANVHFCFSCTRSGHMTVSAKERREELCWGFLRSILLSLVTATDASGADKGKASPYLPAIQMHCSCSHLATTWKRKSKSE